MKKTIIMFILIIPLALAMYGGETEIITTLDNCMEINVTVSAEHNIEEGEYELLDCMETESNKWFCECYDNYDLILSTTTRTINNYSFLIEYFYQVEEAEEDSDENGGSSGSSSRRSSTSGIKCEEWSECVDGESTQYCYELRNSNVNYIKHRICDSDIIGEKGVEEEKEPETEEEKIIEPPQQEATKEKQSNWGWWLIIGIIMIIIGMFSYLRMK